MFDKHDGADAYVLQAIRSAQPLLLLDVICPHCQRENYATRARLIQPIAAVVKATSKHQALVMQSCTMPLEEADSSSEHSEIRNVKQLFSS